MGEYSASGMSRRDLMRFGGVAALGTLGMTALAGCSTPAEENLPETGGAAEFTPMTDEERAAAVNNPVFMGSKNDKNGKELKIVEMPNGGLAPEVCLDYDKDFDPRLVEVIPNKVYCAIGNTNANSAMIIGDTGIIVIDTAESEATGNWDYDLFKTVPGVAERPISAVIYTHDHYCGGTTAYVGEGNPNNVPIIAHELLAAAKFGTTAMNVPSMAMRATRQFGNVLPQEGPDALIGAGMGRFQANPADTEQKSGFILPNTNIPASDEFTEMTIDGVRIQFWPLVSDSIASMNMWFPDMKMALTNQVWNAFYNIYPLRGQIFRDPNSIIKGIDICLSWQPEYHVACHGMPMIGAEECQRGISLFRDSLQFLNDQTLRGMNLGLTPDEIVRSITFPDEIIEAVRPLYGDPEYYIRGIYSGMVGWFGNDAIELHPVSKEFESKKFVEAMGGVDAAVAECENVLGDEQWSWAATLATHVLRVDPENADATRIKAEAFRQMGYRSKDSSSRNWYLTEALRLEGKVGELPWAGGAMMLAGGYATGEKNYFIQVLGINLNPEKAKGVNKTLTFNFTDTGDVETMSIHSCVAQSIRGAIESPDVELKMPFALIPAIGVGQMTIKDGISAGQIEMAGSEADLDTIINCFDMVI